ncbi:MAG: tetratricopeptide repeat protein [Bacteroidales bacterium]|nr:tetratricopeptide repeat protein [Bacteroidales bacterium]MCF8334078.1 tetratricopeptide repeat protein [Bacteroidales bacterium]
MDLKTLKNNYAKVVKFALKGRVKDAFSINRRLLNELGDGYLSDKQKDQENNYKSIIKYTFEGVEDPDREKLLDNVIKNLLEINDQAFWKLRAPHLSHELYQRKKFADSVKVETESDVNQVLEDISLDKEISAVLEGLNVSEPDNSEDTEDTSYTVKDIFYYLFMKDKLSEADNNLLYQLAGSDTIGWYEKGLFVSALTISLFNCFDVKKFEGLSFFYKQKENKVWHRALVGMVMGFYIYDQRLRLYPKLNEMLFQLGEDPSSDKDIESIIIQLNRSKDTEKVSKKMQDEIIPEMMKLKPKIEDKLGLEELMKDDPTEDKNPDWERFFEDTPGLVDKMEEFSKMQMEGSDVFMSAFAMLKHFPFFKELSNWFLPFYTENPQVQQVIEGEEVEIDKKKFLDGIQNSAFMCNSDKYSFIFNIQNMPQQQKQMMFQMLQSELDQMNELSQQDEMIDDSSRNKTIFVQYIQDLYRFFKLNPYKEDFEDLFSYNLDIHNTSFFSKIVSDSNVIRNIGEFYFESEHYNQAVEIYSRLQEEGANEPEIYEKLGYSYQKMEKFELALENYKKAELFDSNRIWNLKKIGYCYRKLGDNDEAVKYYKDASRLSPDEPKIQASIAYTYLQQEDYENALQHYMEVEKMMPDKPSVKRPVAFCAFVQGKLDMANSYYEELLQQEDNRFDLMNMGHVMWCKGRLQDALSYYKQSINQKDNNLKKFLAGFEEDKKHLINNGVDSQSIPLIIDHMRYQLLEREQ